MKIDIKEDQLLLVKGEKVIALPKYDNGDPASNIILTLIDLFSLPVTLSQVKELTGYGDRNSICMAIIGMYSESHTNENGGSCREIEAQAQQLYVQSLLAGMIT